MHHDRLLVYLMGAVLALLIPASTGCDRQVSNNRTTNQVEASAGQAEIWCTAWPLYSMTRQLADNEIAVNWLAPPAGFDAVSRRTWFPSDDQLAAVQSARLLVDNGPGAPYAWWTGMTSLSEHKVCNSTVDYALEDYIPVREMQITHSHGPEGDHSHDYLVPFVWHDPALAAKQVRTIAIRLAREWPEHAQEIQGRMGSARRDLWFLVDSMKLAGQRMVKTGTVVLATPDLLFAARGLDLGKVRTELWAGDTDLSGWEERLGTLAASGEAGQPTFLLFSGDVPAAARRAAETRSDLVLVGIDMLEKGVDNETVAGRLGAMARQISAACDEAGR